MSQLGFPAVLLGGRFGDGLPGAAAQAAQMLGQQAAITPDLLYQGLARAADARQRTAELTARMRADQAAGFRDALVSALSDYQRNQRAAQDRTAAAREGGLERASRERIAEADRTARSADRAAERDTAIDVANIGADARRDVADTNHGGVSLGKTLDALGQERTKAQLENDAPRAARAQQLLTDGYQQAYDAATSEEEQRMVLQRARQAGVEVGPDRPTQLPPRANPAAGPQRTWLGYLSDFSYPVRNTLMWPFGGAERSAQPIGPPAMLAPASQPVQPFGVQDFYRSMDSLPPPASQPVGLPATQSPANPLYINGIDWADVNRNRR